MIDWLIHRFVKDYENIHDSKVREQYGRVTSITGIACNIFLFTAKFTAGTLFHSVAIVADAVNNLSDAGSSVVSLVSFKLSSRPADEEHPFGHERFEYIASLAVAFLVLLVGLELARTSVDKIMHPDPIVFSMLSVTVLIVSILVKLWMYSYNRKIARRIDSSMMQATAADSISDVMATGAVLAATILSPLVHVQLDGYMGVIVALFILYTGYGIVRSTIDQLLGQAPSEDQVKMISNTLKKYDGVLGYHDLVIHSYGPNRCFATVHVEVNSKEDVLISHDMIDNIERDFAENHHMNVVIHLDPIVLDDEEVNAMRDQVRTIIQNINEVLTMHDFRMVVGETHTNLIFDVVVPQRFPLTDIQLHQQIDEKLHKINQQYRTVITFDRTYTKLN